MTDQSAVQRRHPPRQADEKTMLTAFLDYQRATFAWKCSELTAEQLRTRAVAPSQLSLLGLLRHLADVERSWFRRTLNAENAPPLHYINHDDWDRQFTEIDDVVPADAFAVWEAECTAAREVVKNHGLDDTATRRGEVFSMRWILLHMIEEYARHNGHADLLREAIDGSVGE